MKKLGILLYMMLAIVIGILCFFAFIIVVFNLGDSFISRDNKPLAIFVGTVTIVGVVVFLFIGKRLIKNNNTIILASILILVTAFLALPTIQRLEDIRDNIKKTYASSHESERVSQVNQVITKSNLPFTLNLKSSHYDTLYYSNILRLNFEKTNEENLTLEEVDQLLSVLPDSQTGYRISILYRKFNNKYERKENSIAIFLDKNKSNIKCYGDEYDLCRAIEKRH